VATVLAVPAYAQYEALVSRISPAVVFLKASKPGLGMSEGSGFFLQSLDGSVTHGGIITACHVVAGAGVVTVYTQAGQTLLASPLSSTCLADVTMLTVEGQDFPTLPLGDTNTIRPGQEILVFGFPLGSRISGTGVSVVRGIIGALRPETGHLQYDAATDPGMSGGPVVTLDGTVVGIHVLKQGNQRFGVASNVALDALVKARLAGPAAGWPTLPDSEYPLTGRWRLQLVSNNRNPQYVGDISGIYELALTQQREQVTGTFATRRGSCELTGTSDGTRVVFELHECTNGLRDGRIAGTLDVRGGASGVYETHVGMLRLADNGQWTAIPMQP
jgi:hypothetical protein